MQMLTPIHFTVRYASKHLLPGPTSGEMAISLHDTRTHTHTSKRTNKQASYCAQIFNDVHTTIQSLSLSLSVSFISLYLSIFYIKARIQCFCTENFSLKCQGFVNQNIFTHIFRRSPIYSIS